MLESEARTASSTLDARRAELARAAVDRHRELEPELFESFGPAGYEHSLHDAELHLTYLSQAVSGRSVTVFGDYVSWAAALLAQRGLDLDLLKRHLAIIQETIGTMCPDVARFVDRFFVEAILRLDAERGLPASYIDDEAPLGSIARAYFEALVASDRGQASQIIATAVEGGARIHDIYLQVFQPVQYEIGRLWQLNQMTVAQEHYCTAATQQVMAQLSPRVFSERRAGRRLVAACAADNLHEIGLRMVADFFEMDGWDTRYFGASVPVADVVVAVRDFRAHVLAVSATTLPQVRHVEDLVFAIRSDPSTRDTFILVGGPPFSSDPTLGERIGVDLVARDAADAVARTNAALEARR